MNKKIEKTERKAFQEIGESSNQPRKIASKRSGNGGLHDSGHLGGQCRNGHYKFGGWSNDQYKNNKTTQCYHYKQFR